ncbi:hypothetical protein [Actinokineospora sp. HUAS TT18]|uniref:hypothetical protein n=1 Tax=Actinokineospora sp. HUAS TT18 TaxID=3447451 RepID=UPI003F523A2E
MSTHSFPVDWFRLAIGEGWGPTLRATFLITVPTAVVLLIAGFFPAVCTTIVLILAHAQRRNLPA